MFYIRLEAIASRVEAIIRRIPNGVSKSAGFSLFEQNAPSLRLRLYLLVAPGHTTRSK